MKLELNLVKLPTYDSLVSNGLIARNRYSIKDDTDALDSISHFIADNIATLDSALTNKAFLDNLQHLTNLTIEDFYAIKYYISINSGLDIWAWLVTDNESNDVEIPDGCFEYSVADLHAMTSMFIPSITRYTYSDSSLKFSDLYKKIQETYDLFNGSISENINNPILGLVESMIPSEKTQGTIPTGLMNYTNNLLDYMGKKIYTIMQF